jgi:hypothetical protein
MTNNITIENITTAVEFQVEVAAADLTQYGSWDFESEYQDFKEGTLFGRDIPAWSTFDRWLDNTHVVIRVENGATTYEMKWHDGHSWVNALGSDATGDDAETIKNICQLVADGKWHDIVTFEA